MSPKCPHFPTCLCDVDNGDRCEYALCHPDWAEAPPIWPAVACKIVILLALIIMGLIAVYGGANARDICRVEIERVP